MEIFEKCTLKTTEVLQFLEEQWQMSKNFLFPIFNIEFIFASQGQLIK